jgi:hypothetical protein
MYTHWAIKVRVVAAYGPRKGQQVWETLSHGPGYREDAIEWLNRNPWTAELGNLKLEVRENLD